MEVVVALAIGLVVLGAVLATYLSAGMSQRVQAATAQMDEDGQLALRLLSSELMLAGYSEPSGVQTAGTVPSFQRVAVPFFLLECGAGLAGAAGPCATRLSNQVGALALVVSYQATARNTLLASGLPSDCRGYGLRNAPLVVNRYYLSSANGVLSLQCLGSAVDVDGGPFANAPVVSNIEGLKLWYAQTGDADPKRQVLRHVAAAQLQGAVSDSASPFDSVVSVRLCVLVRSVEPVSKEAAQRPYRDCDFQTQSSSDGRLRRAYFTTVALRNKMPF